MENLQSIVDEIHHALLPRLGEGKVADYIPQLAHIDPSGQKELGVFLPHLPQAHAGNRLDRVQAVDPCGNQIVECIHQGTRQGRLATADLPGQQHQVPLFDSILQAGERLTMATAQEQEPRVRGLAEGPFIQPKKSFIH